jgi:glycosyltransferase involved in cell wall biosynthesis
MPATSELERLVEVLRRRQQWEAANVLERFPERFRGAAPSHALDALLKRLQVALGHRRMSIGIYDHALHVIGGGQKYMATLASTLQHEFDITFLANQEVDLRRLGDWYGLDLSRSRMRFVPLPFYRGKRWIDSAHVTADMENPFDAVARASADYDVFVNANMLEKVRPLAPLSVFVCHFPDVLPRAHFAAHEYTVLVASSRYASGWVRRRWGLEPSLLLYPPTDAAGPAVAKEQIILSVARFEPEGSKKQLEMIEAFRHLRNAIPERIAGWRLLLVGGSLRDNAYLELVRKAAARDGDSIEVRVNIPFEELRTWYARASIFWHACGLGERDPHLVEHFGMTTVEAMQNRCAPVVIDGGGQREIVEHGVSGFRFQALEELCAWTARLVDDGSLRTTIQEGASERSKRFGRAEFESRGQRLFDLLHREYATIAPTDPCEPDRPLRVDSESQRG